MGGGGMKGAFDPLPGAGEGGQELGRRVCGLDRFQHVEPPAKCYPYVTQTITLSIQTFLSYCKYWWAALGSNQRLPD